MYMPDSKTLAKQVEDAIKADPQLRSADIDVKVDEGEVTLRGVVDNLAQQQRVLETVRAMPTVKFVENDLRIRGEGSQSAGEYFDDSMITASVKTKLLGEKGLSSLKIHVETKDGIVQLTGSTDTVAHSNLAESVAKTADGVKAVKNGLIIEP